MSEDDSIFMLDTNVFNRATVDAALIDTLLKLKVVATGVQIAELRATKASQRRDDLIAIFTRIAPVPMLASSFHFGVAGAGWDEACWNDGSGRFEEMLTRLQILDAKAKKKIRDPMNQNRDIIIAETAIKNNAVLVSDDTNLRDVVGEFGGKAISSMDL